MVRIRYHFIQCILFFIVCIGLTGCAVNSERTQTLIAESTGLIDKESPSENISITYQSYLKKIWGGEGWDGNTYIYPMSFFITKVENGRIEGKIATETVATPDFNYYKNTSLLDEFTGTIDNGRAECQFDGKNGNKGSLVLEFKEGDEIVAAVEYLSVRFRGAEDYNNYLYKIYGYPNIFLPMTGTYLFRPYNLKDTEGETVKKNGLYEIDLDSWEKVRLVTVTYNSKKPYPRVYLTDECNNILYEFSAPFQTGTEILNVIVEDMNGDGLKDIKMITDYEEIVWVFYQKENGFYYIP